MRLPCTARRERQAIAAALRSTDLDGTDIHIHCLDCTDGVIDYNGTFPLTENYQPWGAVHSGHRVDVTLDGESLPSVVLPTVAR
jgi:hypothetical protein